MAKSNQKTNQSDEGQLVKSFRCGAVAVSVWKRQHEGKTYFSATPSRSFQRDENAEWEYSDTLNYYDLPGCAQLLNMAFAWITVERAKEATSDR